MRLNISMPFQMARWIIYALILLFVEVLFIIPIANLMWVDFANKLVPEESRKLLNLSNMQTNWIIPFDSNLLHIGKNNFYPESKLRTDIPYELTLRFGIYCTSNVPINSAILEIDSQKTRINFACFRDTSGASKKLGSLGSLATVLKKEYINDFEFSFPVDVRNSNLTVKILEFDNAFTLDYVQAQFSIEYKGLRKFLIRSPNLSHLLGTFLFTILISLCFLLSFACVFGYVTVIR